MAALKYNLDYRLLLMLSYVIRAKMSSTWKWKRKMGEFIFRMV